MLLYLMLCWISIMLKLYVLAMLFHYYFLFICINLAFLALSFWLWASLEFDCIAFYLCCYVSIFVILVVSHSCNQSKAAQCHFCFSFDYWILWHIFSLNFQVKKAWQFRLLQKEGLSGVGERESWGSTGIQPCLHKTIIN